MSEYTVRGTFETRHGPQPFESTVEAPNEAVARERLLSNFGSWHGRTRRQVDVEEVST